MGSSWSSCLSLEKAEALTRLDILGSFKRQGMSSHPTSDDFPSFVTAASRYDSISRSRSNSGSRSSRKTTSDIYGAEKPPDTNEMLSKSHEEVDVNTWLALTILRPFDIPTSRQERSVTASSKGRFNDSFAAACLSPCSAQHDLNT